MLTIEQMFKEGSNDDKTEEKRPGLDQIFLDDPEKDQ